MELSVSQNAIVAMGLAMAAAVALPVVYAIYARKVLGIKALFTGIITYMAFGMLLATLWLNAVVSLVPSLQENMFAYALVYCVSLGIIEELGRYLSMHLMRNKLEGRGVPLSFGIGYCAIPTILTGGSNMYVRLSSAAALNNNGLETVLTSVEEDLQEELTETLTELAETSYSVYILYALGMVTIFIMAVSLSVIVWCSVKDEKIGVRYTVFAMLAHVIVFLPEELYYCGVISSGAAGEVCTLILALATAIVAYKMYTELNGPYVPEADRVNRYSL